MIRFGSDSGSGSPTLDPTFKEVLSPDPVSDPATLVSASKELGGKLALFS
jgi:hypothetical protein